MSEKALTTAGTAARTASGSFRWSSALLWVVVFALIGLLGWGLVNANATRPEAGEVAPAFEMQFFDGYEWQNRPIADLSDLKGQVVVLNFWASWCVECKVEASLLENTWRKYQDRGVVFVGITYADVEPNALQYLKEYDVTYPNAPDLGTVISADYEITGVPETFLIDKDGVIQYVQIGPVSDPSFSQAIEQLLAKGG